MEGYTQGEKKMSLSTQVDLEERASKPPIRQRSREWEKIKVAEKTGHATGKKKCFKHEDERKLIEPTKES